MLRLEIVAHVRALFPGLATRRLVVGASMFWVLVSGAGLGITFVGSGVPSQIWSSLTTICATAGIIAAISTSIKLHEDSSRELRWRLTPQGPAIAALIRIGGATAVASWFGALLAIPLAAAAALVDSRGGLVMLSVFVAGVMWGTTIALLLLSAARIYGGDELALKLGKALPIPLIVLTTAGVRSIMGSPLPLDNPAWLLAIVAPIPIAWVGATRLWQASMRVRLGATLEPEPDWGTVSWMRMITRTGVHWMGLVTVLALVLTMRRFPTVVLWMAIVLPMIPIFHLMKWEDDAPARMRLAPEASRMRTRMALSIGMPASGVALAAAAMFIDSPGELAAVVGLCAAGPFVSVLEWQTLRVTLQSLVMIGAAILSASV
jgi:hypothetical protein